MDMGLGGLCYRLEARYPTMTREQRPAPHLHVHGDLTSLTPEEQGHWSGLPFPSPMHESEK